MSHKIIAHNISQADIDKLSEKLDERCWGKVCTVSQLRRHLKFCELPRRILSNLWLAVIHLSAKHDATETIIKELNRAKEISDRGSKEQMSKYCRAGGAAWHVMSQLGSGVLALVDLAYPTSEEALDDLLCRKELSTESAVYQPQVQKVFDYLHAFLTEKQRPLLELFITSVERVSKEVARKSANGSLREQSAIIDERHSFSGPMHITIDIPSLSREMIFNKITYPRYVVPYSSAIFRRIICGDFASTLGLLLLTEASVYDVDPFGLPLLYYAAYYCMRAKGLLEAINMCKMLHQQGANINYPDEVGSTPLDILADCCIAARRSDETALIMLSDLYGQGSAEIVDDYAVSHGLGEIHQVLLRLQPECPQLEDYLKSQTPEILSQYIDKPDNHGRSALVYAVEYGWHDAVEVLVRFGADVNQIRSGDSQRLTLLHLVFAGPAQETTLEIARILIENGANVDTRDSEGWTALHIATSWNNRIGMALLIAAGAQISAQTFDGETVVTLSADPYLQIIY